MLTWLACREYIEECIDSARNMTNSGLPDEMYGRALFHLATIYKEMGVEAEKAKDLEDEALKLLERLSEHVWPCLKEQNDPMLTFDDMQSIFEGRWTSRKLLNHMQTCQVCIGHGGAAVGPSE